MSKYKGVRKMKGVRLPKELCEKAEKKSLDDKLTFNDVAEKLFEMYVKGEIKV